MTILTPKWKIEMLEKDGKHFYTKNGESSSCVGVTTILGVADKSMALVPWAAKVTAEYTLKMVSKLSLAGMKRWEKEKKPIELRSEMILKRCKKQWRFERDKAGDLGTRFHALMEDPGLEVPEDLKIAMSSANLWLKNTKLKLVKGRTMVISEKYGFGGEWDGLFKNDKGACVVVDFKSGKRLYDSAAAQVAAYGVGAVETYGLDGIPEGLVVRFGKDKIEFEEREVLNMESSFQYFKACLGLYKLMDMGQLGKSNTVKEKDNDRRPRSIRSKQAEISKA